MCLQKMVETHPWIPEKGAQEGLLSCLKLKPDEGIIFIIKRPFKDGKKEDLNLSCV